MNMNSFWQGKTAIITGASGGIGSALAKKMASCGINVMLAGRNTALLEKAAGAAREEGVQAAFFAGDLTQAGNIDELLARTETTFGGFDVLINSAGLAQHCSVEEMTPDQYDKIMALNVKVPYFLCQQAIPYLRRSPCATIINICSVTAHKGYPQQSVYAASKHALLGFSKSLANELFRENIRVHVISPGGVYTDMIALARPDLTADGMTLPEDIADIAAFYLQKRMSNAVIDEISVHRTNKEPFA